MPRLARARRCCELHPNDTATNAIRFHPSAAGDEVGGLSLSYTFMVLPQAKKGRDPCKYSALGMLHVPMPGFSIESFTGGFMLHPTARQDM